MSIFGPDISNYQAGLDLSRLAEASFVIAKTTEGTYYHDSSYDGWRRQAAAMRMPFVWYHFLTTEDVDAQLQNLIAHVGDGALPGMLDVEPQDQTGSRPSVKQILDFDDAARANHLNIRLVYLPRWYWEELGSPDLTALTARGLYLVSSAYPGGSGTPTRLYPGDSASGWDSYGGVTPALYQYTNQATDGGQSLDYNAYRGTLAELVGRLGTTTTTAPGGTMSTIPATIGQFWPEIAGQFPANAAFDNDNALIWADGGARAAALYAKQARDAINALAAKVAAPPPVDVNALAAALAPHLVAGATADQIAAAVVAHLATTLAKG